MLFRVSQISPAIELVFDNTEDYINVYPSYHQQGDLNYRNVDSADWTIAGSQYRWETSLTIITEDSVPVIQLVYSYNATQQEKDQQNQAFRQITAVETVTGKLYLYANSRPSADFRIRYRILNKMDLAIPLNRVFGVGLGYDTAYDQVISYLSGVNPINNQTFPLSANIPAVTNNSAGVAPGGLLSRIEKLEDNYNGHLTQPYCIVGYDSSSALSPISTYYPDITSVQAVAADTWYKECEIWTRTDASDFTTASHLFYQQRATTLNLTHIYTGNVTTFSYALAANVLLQSIKGLHLLDTHNATDISYMFYNDAALTEIDLSQLCLDKVTNIEGLFKGCTSLTEINVSNIDFTFSVGVGTNLIDQPDIFTDVPDACTIWVSGSNQRDAILARYPNLTGITYN